MKFIFRAKVRHFLFFALGLFFAAFISAPARAELPVCPTCNQNPNALYELKDFFGELFSVSVVTEQKAQELFREMLSKDYIPFHYPQEGCFARAHEMTWLMEGKGVITGKVFLTGNLRVETRYSPSGFVAWNWHVAPFLAVKKNNKILLFVIDPSMESQAVTLDDWIAHQTTARGTFYTDLDYTKRFVYNYGEKRNYIKRDFYDKDDWADARSEMAKNLKLQKDLESWQAALQKTGSE